jgi:TolA-binding protein
MEFPSDKAGWVSDGRWPRGKESAMETPAAQLARAMDLEKAGSPGAAAVEYEKLIRIFPESAEAEKAHLGAGRCRFLCGQFRAAEEQLAELRRRFAKTELLDAAAEIEVSIARGYLDGKGADGGLPLRTRTRRARAIFERILKDDAMSRWADDAMFGLGLCHKTLGRYDLAIEQFKEMLDRYPWSELKAEAEMQIAECVALENPSPDYEDSEERDIRTRLDATRNEAYAKGRELDDAALRDAERILAERQAKKKYDQAVFYEGNGKWRAAEVCLEFLIARYPDTKWAEMARERLEVLRKR